MTTGKIGCAWRGAVALWGIVSCEYHGEWDIWWCGVVSAESLRDSASMLLTRPAVDIVMSAVAYQHSPHPFILWFLRSSFCDAWRWWCHGGRGCPRIQRSAVGRWRECWNLECLVLVSQQVPALPPLSGHFPNNHEGNAESLGMPCHRRYVEKWGETHTTKNCHLHDQLSIVICRRFQLPSSSSLCKSSSTFNIRYYEVPLSHNVVHRPG